MKRFRFQWPCANVWATEAARKKWKASMIGRAEAFEAQRQYEDSTQPLTM